MASVHGPLMSIEASGSISAMTFYRGRGQQCARLRWPGIRRRSTAASVPRAQLMTQVAYHWVNLTQAQRSAWDDFARSHLMQSKAVAKPRIDSRSWFSRLNACRLVVGQAIMLLPPPSALCAWHPRVQVGVDSSHLALWLSEQTPSNHHVIIRQQRNLQPSNQHDRWMRTWGIESSILPDPYWISGEIGQPSTEPGWPAVLWGHGQLISVTIQDHLGRRAPTLRFSVIP